METLRERDSALLRPTADRKTNGSSNGYARNPDDSAPTATDRAYSVPTMETTNIQAANANRFARDYNDPAFPRHEVKYATAKRVFDVVITSAIVLALLPVMLVIAIIIKATSKGPIIFKQIRVGEGGRHFWCYKFRSMCVDAEDKKKELMHLNEASGPVFKMKRDPRVTPIGALVRKTSLDELPQLFNVLKGDMSLVGPRPPIPSEVALYGPHERKRLAVRPGITCIWQVSGRSNVSFEHWVELDLLYIDTMSFTTDIRILCQTIPAVVKGSGAH